MRDYKHSCVFIVVLFLLAFSLAPDICSAQAGMMPVTPNLSPNNPLTLPINLGACQDIEAEAEQIYLACNQAIDNCQILFNSYYSLCANELDTCDPADMLCQICQQQRDSVAQQCWLAHLWKIDLTLQIQDLVVQYQQGNCFGCFLDIAGINTYDPCTYNSPRIVSSNPACAPTPTPSPIPPAPPPVSTSYGL